MEATAVPSRRSLASAAVSLVAGVLCCAITFVLLIAMLGWWAVPAAGGCLIAAELLSRFRGRGRIPGAASPSAAAAAVLIVAGEWNGSLWAASAGAVLLGAAGVDLLRRSWEDPRAAQALWGYVKALSLLFGVVSVYMVVRSARDQDDEVAVVDPVGAPVVAPVGSAPMPLPGGVPDISQPATIADTVGAVPFIIDSASVEDLDAARAFCARALWRWIAEPDGLPVLSIALLAAGGDTVVLNDVPIEAAAVACEIEPTPEGLYHVSLRPNDAAREP